MTITPGVGGGPHPGGTPERPCLFFDSAEQLRGWLADHHDTAPDLWMGLRKKHIAPRGLTWDDAVPEALCFGWIDSVVQSLGPDSVRQRWTPRRRGSTWSSVNVAHVERLSAEGRMHPAGLAAFKARTADRQGIYTYEQAESGHLPAEYAARLTADPDAAAFWAAAIPSYRTSCVWWVVSAKQEHTRQRRFDQLLAACAAYDLIPPQRYGAVPAWLTRLRATRPDA